jgi:hypothetical protein
MKELFKIDYKNNKKLSKKIIKIILIAAILLSFATTVFAIPSYREFIVDKFSNHSEYNVADTKNAEKVTALKLNYIPDGFEKTEEYEYTLIYKKGDKSFSVAKYQLSANINFDTEEYESENIKINNIDAIYYRSNTNQNGIIFNNGKYIFIISGNIDKETLVKIAQNVE